MSMMNPVFTVSCLRDATGLRLRSCRRFGGRIGDDDDADCTVLQAQPHYRCEAPVAVDETHTFRSRHLQEIKTLRVNRGGIICRRCADGQSADAQRAAVGDRAVEHDVAAHVKNDGAVG